MSKQILFIASALFTLAITANASGFTYEKRIKGKDNRGEFDIQYVQISPSALPNDSLRRPVNFVIAQRAREAICEADAERKDNMYSALTTKVNVANPSVLSIDTSEDNYCGGAHPNAGTSSSLFDLRTGKEVKVEDQFADALAFKTLMIEYVIAKVPTGDDAKECAELYSREALQEAFFNYSVRDGKIVATQDYAHVAQACAFDTDLPLRDFASLIKRNSVLQGLVR